MTFTHQTCMPPPTCRDCGALAHRRVGLGWVCSNPKCEHHR